MGDPHDTLPGSAEPIPGRCGALLRNSEKKYGQKRYHMAYPMRGKTRCRLHGGATPSGVESPHWKGKGRSKVLPERLADQFERTLRDPNVLAIRREAARLDALLTRTWDQLCVVVDDGVAIGDTASATRQELVRLQESILGTNLSGVKTSLKKLHDINQVQSGGMSSDAAIELESRLLTLTEQKRKLVETYHKSLNLATQTYTMQEVASLLGMIGASIRRWVPDREARASIMGEFQEVLDARKVPSLPERGDA